MELPKEGYLLMYHESGDEIHINLISKEDYDKIVNAITSDKDWIASQKNVEEVMETIEPIHKWFTQTYCMEPWPYNDIKILGTVSICRT